MKKLIFFTVLLFASNAFSQKNPNIKGAIGTNPNTVITALNGVLITDIQVDEFPAFTGKRENPRLKDGKLVASFPLNKVSMSVPQGKIVYLKFCNAEFPYEAAYSESQANINLEGVCGVRSDDLVTYSVRFTGISTGVHNNDCKKVFGSINIKLKEVAPDGTESFMRPITGAAFRGADVFTFRPMNIASADAPKNISNYVFNDARITYPCNNIVTSGSVGNDEANFKIGKSALQSGRANLIVVSNIAGAHKMNDLADYSSNIHMDRAVTEVIPLESSYPYHGLRSGSGGGSCIFLGPYTAHGDPDKSIQASGGYWFTQNFRVHLNLNYQPN